MTEKPPPEPFDKLLGWLDPDREQAGIKYQTIQSRLIAIFANHGCIDPEARADETIDRVTAKIDWLVENYVGEPIRYFGGVARNVLKEDIRKRLPPNLPADKNDPIDDQEQQMYDCFDKCMSELTQGSQTLVLAYYEDEGQGKIRHRKKLAEEHGISMTALRLRVFHLRGQLGECLKRCLDQDASR